MSRWVQFWSQFRLRGSSGLANSLKLRTQSFVHRLYDQKAASWLRFYRRQHYARAVACVRAALDTPRRRILMLSATGVYKSRGEENDASSDVNKNVTDAEMQDLVNELERTKQLSRETLYCPRCSLRLIIDTRHPGVKYCMCKNGRVIPLDAHNGWTPYMETEDVIIWRKEYKEGTKLYMYKVYGRYDNVTAADFLSVQLDMAYRRSWDRAVASLFTLQRDDDEHVIYWEVMWPRMFANRDYVYVRRHKEFCVQRDQPEAVVADSSKHNVNGRNYSKSRETGDPDRLFVIVSKSVQHPKCPVNNNAIRVTEYWSHMVIRSLKGPEKPGMEFVLTYFDQPAVGGMPCGVATWATGRAAPRYLAAMRAAALDYSTRALPQEEDIFEEAVAGGQRAGEDGVREEDMESWRRGPIIDEDETKNGDDGDGAASGRESPRNVQDKVGAKLQLRADNTERVSDEDGEGTDDPDGWWHYLYLFDYFA